MTNSNLTKNYGEYSGVVDDDGRVLSVWVTQPIDDTQSFRVTDLAVEGLMDGYGPTLNDAVLRFNEWNELT